MVFLGNLQGGRGMFGECVRNLRILGFQFLRLVPAEEKGSIRYDTNSIVLSAELALGTGVQRGAE